MVLVEMMSEQEVWALLETLVRSIIEKQKADPRYPYHLHEQKEIDELVYKLYHLSGEDVREIEMWFCRRYPKLAKAQGFWAECETKYADYLEWAGRQTSEAFAKCSP